MVVACFGRTSMRKPLSRPEQDDCGTSQTSIRHQPPQRRAMRHYAVAPIHTSGVAVRHVRPRGATSVPLSILTWNPPVRDTLLGEPELFAVQAAGSFGSVVRSLSYGRQQHDKRSKTTSHSFSSLRRIPLLSKYLFTSRGRQSFRYERGLRSRKCHLHTRNSMGCSQSLKGLRHRRCGDRKSDWQRTRYGPERTTTRPSTTVPVISSEFLTMAVGSLRSSEWRR
jgi:hypothetical protein